MMMKIVAATAVTVALVHGAALAQSGNPAQSATSPKNEQSLPQEIKRKLTAQGFTNVQVVPGSYLVSAKDKDGDPVTMVIGPHSMTMFTVENQASAPGNQQDTYQQ